MDNIYKKLCLGVFLLSVGQSSLGLQSFVRTLSGKYYTLDFPEETTNERLYQLASEATGMALGPVDVATGLPISGLKLFDVDTLVPNNSNKATPSLDGTLTAVYIPSTVVERFSVIDQKNIDQKKAVEDKKNAAYENARNDAKETYRQVSLMSSDPNNYFQLLQEDYKNNKKLIFKILERLEEAESSGNSDLMTSIEIELSSAQGALDQAAREYLDLTGVKLD